ncbi:MAG: hypothetical protein HOW73_41215 [Polyangiaceae bacterium]|nr:hypothetical protein [Polyangiaceae bacterium]
MECPDGEHCVATSGACVRDCDGATCPLGQVCEGGVCVPGSTGEGGGTGEGGAVFAGSGGGSAGGGGSASNGGAPATGGGGASSDGGADGGSSDGCDCAMGRGANTRSSGAFGLLAGVAALVLSLRRRR